MENIQLNKVKLNVTNLDTFLTKSKKDLQKAKVNKNKFLAKERKKEIRSQEESKLEKIKPITSFLKKGAQKITGKLMSIFDKAMNIFGLLLLGFLVNKLPEILENVSNFIDKVKPALDIAGKIFGAIGTGLGFVFNQLFPNYEKSKVDLNPIEKELKTLNKDLDIEITDLDSTPQQESDENTTRNASDPNVMSDGSVIKVGDTVGGSDFTPTRPKVSKPLMRNRGGLVSKNKNKDKQNKLKSSGTKKYDFKSYKTFSSPKTLDLYGKNIEKLSKIFKTSKSESGSGNTSKNSSTAATDSPDMRGLQVASAGLTSGQNISGYQITSPYGPRWGRTHGGIDVGTPQGTALSLAADGEIVFAGLAGGYGNVIDAWLPKPGVQLRLAHLSQIIKGSGTFKANEILARTGGASGTFGAGSSTGPHLHFEADLSKGSARYGGSGNPSKYANLLLLGSISAKKSTDGKGGLLSPSPSNKNSNINQPMNGGSSENVIIMPIEVEKIIKVPTGGGVNSSVSKQSSGSSSNNLNNIP